MNNPDQQDYTNIDFDSLRESMLNRATEIIPEWTDHSDNDFGTALIELSAYAADICLYYQNRIARNLFPSTSDEPEALIQLLRFIGYELHNGQAATTLLRLGFDAGTVGPVVVPARTSFTTSGPDDNPLVFETLRDYTITDAELTTPDASAPDPEDRLLRLFHPITVVEGQSTIDEVVGVIDGSPNQAFILPERKVLPDSIELGVEEPAGRTRWHEVESLANSGPGDRHFVVRTNATGESEVQLGDGANGLLLPATPPATPTTVFATYRTGGGSQGNLPANRLFATNHPDIRRATSLQAGAGGQEPESIQRAQMLAPRLFRTNQNAVTAQDYADLASAVPGVGKVFAVAANWNHVALYIAPAGQIERPSEVLERAVLQFLEPRRMLTTAVSVIGPGAADIYITARVVVKPYFSRIEAAQTLSKATSNYFDFDNVEFGQQMHVSRLYDAMQSLPFVDSVFIGQFSLNPAGTIDNNGTIELEPHELPRLGYLVKPPAGTTPEALRLVLDGGVV